MLKRSITIANKNKDKIETKNEELSETFNSFFSSRVENLKIECDIDRQEIFDQSMLFSFS